jgi:tetratricopeptide (TPR) repeat protein
MGSRRGGSRHPYSNGSGARRSSPVDEAFAAALAAHRRGDLETARANYTRVLECEPKHFDALHLLGVVASDLGQPDVAQTLIGLALEIRPRASEAMGNLALVLKALGRTDEAEALLRSALKIAPDFVNALRNLASLLQARGEHAEAMALLQRAARLSPSTPAIHANLGALLLADGQAEAAWPHLARAVEFAPNEASYHANLGRAALELDRVEAGVAACEHAVRIAPRHVPALVTLAALERVRGRLDVAQRYALAALDAAPDDRSAWVNLATVLSDMGELETATQVFDQLLQRDPCDVEAHTSRAAICLARGLPDRAWPDHPWRWRLPGAPVPCMPALSEWQGECLADGTLHVWPEQGLGDEILFASLYPELLERTPRVIVACDARLMAAMERSFPRARIVPTAALAQVAAQATERDRQCSIADLGAFLRPTLDTFPHRQGYLVPDRAHAERWRTWLDTLGEGMKIGFSWRSQNLRGERRLACTTLEQWGAVFVTTGVHFVCLQYDDCEAELAEAEARFGVTLHRPPGLDQRNDLDGVMALMAGLDLVVTAPTTVSALAGAVGAPTWQLIRGIDWQGMACERSPWQPAVRPMRRPWNVTWDDALGEVAAELRVLASRRVVARAA